MQRGVPASLRCQPTSHRLSVIWSCAAHVASWCVTVIIPSFISPPNAQFTHRLDLFSAIPRPRTYYASHMPPAPDSAAWDVVAHLARRIAQRLSYTNLALGSSSPSSSIPVPHLPSAQLSHSAVLYGPCTRNLGRQCTLIVHGYVFNHAGHPIST